MATVYRDDDVDLSAMYGRTVAVLGYGRLGETSALCLRDSGIDVRVGLAPGDFRRGAAEAEGLATYEPAEACAGADVLVITVPPAQQRRVYDDVVVPALGPGTTVILPNPFLGDPSQGDALPRPAEKGRLAVVSLQGSPMEARRRFVDGRGVPALVALVGDGGGDGLDVPLAYARALGCTRSGAVLTSLGELADATAFARAAVGSDRIGGLLRAALSVLTSAGYDHDVAVLSCWTAIREAAEGLAAAAAPTGPAGSVDPAELERLRRLEEQLRSRR